MNTVRRYMNTILNPFCLLSCVKITVLNRVAEPFFKFSDSSPRGCRPFYIDAYKYTSILSVPCNHRQQQGHTKNGFSTDKVCPALCIKVSIEIPMLYTKSSNHTWFYRRVLVLWRCFCECLFSLRRNGTVNLLPRRIWSEVYVLLFRWCF